MNSKKRAIVVTGSEVGFIAFLSIFVIVAIGVWVAFGTRDDAPRGFLILWSLIFGGIPLSIIAMYIKRIMTRANARRLGELNQAKVIDYQEDYSTRVNGRPVNDIVVAFFKNGTPCRATVDVDILRRGKYPIGSTVDIYEYEGEYIIGSTAYDEYIPNEQVLLNTVAPSQSMMSTYNQPVAKVVRQTIVCPHCGEEIIVENM